MSEAIEGIMRTVLSRLVEMYELIDAPTAARLITAVHWLR